MDIFMLAVTLAASPRLIQDFETLALYKGHFPKQDWLKIGVWTPKQTPPGNKLKSWQIAVFGRAKYLIVIEKHCDGVELKL